MFLVVPATDLLNHRILLDKLLFRPEIKLDTKDWDGLIALNLFLLFVKTLDGNFVRSYDLSH